MTLPLDIDRLRRGYHHIRELLLAERTPAGHWVGELSTSALSTATAVMALIQVRKAATQPEWQDEFDRLIAGGIDWLVAHQNEDGGWGDTVKSISNISTTMLCRASLVASPESSVQSPERSWNDAVQQASEYIDQAGGIPALIARYGKDKTFSIPILTHCALAGLVEWKDITPLPFELACIPAKFYKTVRLPVVSYALPALIAIGQVRHHFAPTWNPITRVLRNLSINRSLKILERIQPTNGGFLEATPLTSFVTMSLAAKGLANHPVVTKGVQFIVDSVRDDGSWPIDTNLATWVTTLSVNALGDDLPDESRVPILNWLLDQQYTEVHLYTNADPGGWSWTDLPGGVPDADDTPGAVLALLELSRGSSKSPESSVQSPELLSSRVEGLGTKDEHDSTPGTEYPVLSPDANSPTTAGQGTMESRPSTESLDPRPSTLDDPSAPSFPSSGLGTPSRVAAPRNGGDDLTARVEEAVDNAVDWLISLQNRDGGFPTFCRGWGKLPFDRSSPDITAHCIRAISRLQSLKSDRENAQTDLKSFEHDPLWQAIHRGSEFLRKEGTRNGPHRGEHWLPLWFGNQHHSAEESPTYGTARVTKAFHDIFGQCGERQAGCLWLRENQNSDGGWGAGPGTPSSVEETSLATEILLEDTLADGQVVRGLNWLLDRIDDGTVAEPSPIGFYFAKLWYFERLYPLIFAVSCLRRAVRRFEQEPPPIESPSSAEN